MANEYSLPELMKFLDYLRNKGLMKPDSVAARKAAANSIFGILEEDEAADLRKIDLDAVATRFSNKKGSDFRPESIRVYKSRAGASLADFFNYRKNPMGFKPIGASSKPSASQKYEKVSKTRQAKQEVEASSVYTPSSNEVTFPIPIRPDVVIKIVGLPSDLTKREATKIANVVMALVQETEK